METINISNPNDGLGDKVRNAFLKVNNNFSELLGLINDINLGADISDIVGLQSALDNLEGQIAVINSQMLILQTNIDTNNLSVAEALLEIDDINAQLVVITDGFINESEKGVANGVATLDSSGLVPTSQLPSYVDDVVEGADLTALNDLPASQKVSGKIYVALDTNLTYRWGGSSFVLISSGAVQSVAGKTGVVTLVKADVGLNLVDNTADSAKNVLSATKLTTARTINGVPFNGTANITIPTGNTYTASEGIELVGFDFRPKYGTTLASVAQGNDSRILNGAIAYGWGNHSLEGYLKAVDITGKADKTITMSAGTGLTGGGNLSANRTFDVDFGNTVGKVTQGNDSRLSDARTPLAHTHPQSDIIGLEASLNSGNASIASLSSSVTSLNGSKADKTTTISAGTGLTGGGNLSGNRTLAVNFGTTATTVAKGNHTHTMVQVDGLLDAINNILADKADKVISVSAGTGLIGGGNLSANRSLAVNFGTTASTVAVGNHTHTFDSLTSKPTNLFGYGITDGIPIEKFDDLNKPVGYKILRGISDSALNTPTGTWTQGIQFSASNNADYANQLVFDLYGRLFKRTLTPGVVGKYYEIASTQTDSAFTNLPTPGISAFSSFTTKTLRFKIHKGYFVIDGEFKCNGTSGGTYTNIDITDIIPSIDPELIDVIKLDTTYASETSLCFSAVYLSNVGGDITLKATVRPNIAGTTKFRASLPIANF